MNNNRTRIKICGITRTEDALFATSCGIDAIGMIFYSASPRAVNIEQALEITEVLPPFVTTVGLFVNADKTEVEEVLSRVDLDLLQFHGDEDDAYCRSVNRPYIKALRVKPGMNLETSTDLYSGSRGILLDAWHKEMAGGTGESFDWELARQLGRKKPLVLAGGIDHTNVAEAINLLHPYAVDANSRLEISPGIKSPEKIRQLVEEIARVSNG